MTFPYRMKVKLKIVIKFIQDYIISLAHMYYHDKSILLNLVNTS